MTREVTSSKCAFCHKELKPSMVYICMDDRCISKYLIKKYESFGAEDTTPYSLILITAPERLSRLQKQEVL
ncbi:hypothetical protein COT97_01395 [Candidatus Falkowbacteria bacterium CG10_big_fil_rev_8_21_14_0_10_39_11]|uniref:Uncharacterized protein n=1 Tax=Candidatus Falkowbacteria bacterium CG10_big_fil_rev_8_21_14_0_10_39_11 TaxID=1974565 RepID=A0A2H0V7Q6_9BACT|nr:MAG: hypothetical protein COT97_01395 [Candidatus Falkowbacteria bacterium CG10_big_fil_rev_8_21_14_0_10_39_11]